MLTGNDGLAAGLEQGLWVDLAGKYGSKLPDLKSVYQEPAAKMQELAQGKGGVVTYYPSGPLIEHDPGRVPPRVLGQVPKGVKTGSLKGFSWVTDAHYMTVPKGISGEKLAVMLEFMKFALSPEQQAITYDKGYFYPGPAVNGVTLDMAPPESRKVIEEFGRPEYEQLIAGNPKEPPLDAKAMVQAFDRWDREIGGDKVKKTS
ncbi:MAG: hypothetical protein GEV11_30000 [Streptosporangiales bacterium]|nr:hypothetical protein [Streptosporangiales bacterium]